MTKPIQPLLLILVAAFFWASPTIASTPPTPVHAELQKLLDDRKFPQLDAALMAYQAAYRNGQINDQTAAQAFIYLTRTDPDLSVLYDEWIAALPKSYAARLARGYYLMQLGYLARGKGYVKDTTKAQFEAANLYFQKANSDLELSLQLEQKPTLSYGTLITIAQAQGTRTRMDALVRDAIKLDSHTYSARISYLQTLRPEWGGSIEEMQLHFEKWKTSVTAQQARVMHDVVESARQKQSLSKARAYIDGKQFSKAIVLFSEAIEKNPTAYAYTMRGYSHLQIDQPDKALDDFNNAVKINPDASCCTFLRANRAAALLALGRPQEALPELEIAAEADDAWAASKLAIIYAFGRHGIKRDLIAAHRWCERAAKRGDGLSMYCLGSLYYAGIAVPKDLRLAAKWFEGAADRDIADAQTDLAFMYWTGQGVNKDSSRALYWWRRAADLGNERARAQLRAKGAN